MWTINMTNAVATIAGVDRGAKNLSTSFTPYRSRRVLYVTEKATSCHHVLRIRTGARGYTQTEEVVSDAVIHLIWRKTADCGSRFVDISFMNWGIFLQIRQRLRWLSVQAKRLVRMRMIFIF